MTVLTIANFVYFLEDLEKTLGEMDALSERFSELLGRAHVSNSCLSEMCENWKNQLEHQK